MELQQQEYIRKIRLKLSQPSIICSGRKRVECYYSGKLIFERNGYKKILIKSYNQPVEIEFFGHECITPGFENLKII